MSDREKLGCRSRACVFQRDETNDRNRACKCGFGLDDRFLAWAKEQTEEVARLRAEIIATRELMARWRISSVEALKMMTDAAYGAQEEFNKLNSPSCWDKCDFCDGSGTVERRISRYTHERKFICPHCGGRGERMSR